MSKRFQKPDLGDERTYSNKPPIPETSLVEIYKTWRKKGNESDHIPKPYLEGALFWIRMQEPRRPQEQPQAQTDRHGDTHWADPYINRLDVTWRRFLDLSEINKAFVLDGITNRNTPWRGDSIEFYKQVLEEQEKFEADPETYKQQAGIHLPGAKR